MYRGKRLTAKRLQEIQENELNGGWRYVDGKPVDVFNNSRESLIRTNNYVHKVEGERDDLLDEIEILREEIQASKSVLVEKDIPQSEKVICGNCLYGYTHEPSFGRHKPELFCGGYYSIHCHKSVSRDLKGCPSFRNRKLIY